MGRSSVIITVACAAVLSLSTVVNAAPATPADIDACRERAAITARTNDKSVDTRENGSRGSDNVPHAGQPAGSSSSNTDQTAGRQTPEKSDGSASPPDTEEGRDVTAAYRSAFAACLAEHGYYKGYYR
jgi:hypothetical protein